MANILNYDKGEAGSLVRSKINSNFNNINEQVVGIDTNVSGINTRLNTVTLETETNNTTIHSVIKGDFIGLNGTTLLSLTKSAQGVIIECKLLDGKIVTFTADINKLKTDVSGMATANDGLIKGDYIGVKGSAISLIKSNTGVTIDTTSLDGSFSMLATYVRTNESDIKALQTSLSSLQTEQGMQKDKIVGILDSSLLQKMSATKLGVAKVGRNLTIDQDGTLNATRSIGNIINYTLNRDDVLIDSVTNKAFKQNCQLKGDSRYRPSGQELAIQLPADINAFVPIISTISNQGTWDGDYVGMVSLTNLVCKSSVNAVLKIVFYKRDANGADTILATTSEYNIPAGVSSYLSLSSPSTFKDFSMTQYDRIVSRFMLKKTVQGGTFYIMNEGTAPTNTVFSYRGGSSNNITINDVAGLPQIFSGTNSIADLKITGQPYTVGNFMSFAQITPSGIMYVRSGGSNGDGSNFTPFGNLESAQLSLSPANNSIEIMDNSTYNISNTNIVHLLSLDSMGASTVGNISITKADSKIHVSNHTGNITISADNVTLLVDVEMKGNLSCNGKNCKIIINFFDSTTYTIANEVNIRSGSKIGFRTYGYVAVR